MSDQIIQIKDGSDNNIFPKISAPAIEFRGSEVCTAKNGATLDTTASYTRAMKRNGIAIIEIRITVPTISSRTTIATLADALKPQMDITYIKVYDMWNATLVGDVTLGSTGAIDARETCSGKNIQIVMTYPTQTM